MQLHASVLLEIEIGVSHDETIQDCKKFLSKARNREFRDPKFDGSGFHGRRFHGRGVGRSVPGGIGSWANGDEPSAWGRGSSRDRSCGAGFCDGSSFARSGGQRRHGDGSGVSEVAGRLEC